MARFNHKLAANLMYELQGLLGQGVRVSMSVNADGIWQVSVYTDGLSNGPICEGHKPEMCSAFIAGAVWALRGE